MAEIPEFTLREKKHAKTKLALMQAFIKRMEDQRFDDISIKEVCEEVMVSEGTFYNYFPSKINVIYYFATLYHLYIQCEAIYRAEKKSFLSRIDKMFEVMAESYSNPHLVYELISVLVREKTEPSKMDISLAERYYAFPDCKGILEVKTGSVLLREFIRECLEQAQKNQELPEKTDIDEMIISLKTLIAGLPLAVKYVNFKSVPEFYKKQLKVLWKGYGCKRDK